MAQEDDLRTLGKIMDLMRGLFVIFLLINCYWFCYKAFRSRGFTLGIVDKILMNFQRTTGLFYSILWTKLFCVVFLDRSCLGTKGVKEEKIICPKIWAVLAVGCGLCPIFINWWLLALPIGKVGAASLYIFTLSVGYICLLMAGV
jgi:traG family protein